jgi:trk system potassium uptake protein
MYIVISGAGEVGSHTAEVFAAAGHDVTIMDSDAERLAAAGEMMDIGTLHGDCALAENLIEAGIDRADVYVATTNDDETNLFSSSIAKALGAKKTIARVHRGTFFEGRGIDYRTHFKIDQLICPEFSTATAIARTLRNPAAMAIEHFARGKVEMQSMPVSDDAPALGKPLSELDFPRGARLAAVTRGDYVFIPDANTVVEAGDTVILVGNSDVFYDARRMFHREDVGKRKVVIYGGQIMSVWLCRALRDRNWSIRVFETNRKRAEELAERMNWVTVIQADPTDRQVFMEENLPQADVFIAMHDDDEDNIISAVLAKSLGVLEVMAVVQKSNYADMLYLLGVDRTFSPRKVAVTEIEGLLDDSPLRSLASLADGYVDVYRVRVGEDSPIAGRKLKEIKLGLNWIIAALRREGTVWVPSADDAIQPNDIVLLIGKQGMEKQLKKLVHPA